MGLPQINIVFKRLAETILFRSERGIVALILNDDTATKNSYVFRKLEDVKEGTFNSNNLDYLSKVFLGKPSKVLVEVINTENSRTLETVLKDLELKKFSWLTYPTIQTSDISKVTEWVKLNRSKGKSYKAVLANTPADEKGIVNFTTTGIKVGDKSYTTTEYCCRLAGAFAGLSLTRSATYLVLDEVTSITQHDDPNGDIDKGELILTNDGEKIKIGRAVNSLQTLKGNDTKDLKKIKIVESVDLINDDITSTFEDHYVGQCPNGYDNKIIFLSGVLDYFKDLQKREILDKKQDVSADIDIDAHIALLIENGKDPDKYSEQEIKELNTGSVLYATGSVTFLDAMEDLKLNLFM